MLLVLWRLLRRPGHPLANNGVRWLVTTVRALSGICLFVVGFHDLLLVDGAFWPRATSAVLMVLGIALLAPLPRESGSRRTGERVLVWHGATAGLVICAAGLWILAYRFPTPFPTSTQLLVALFVVAAAGSWPLPRRATVHRRRALESWPAKAAVAISAIAGLLPVVIAFAEASSRVGTGLADSPTVLVEVDMKATESGDAALRAVRLETRFRNVSGTQVGVIASVCNVYGDTVSQTSAQSRSIAETVHRGGLDPAWTFSPASTTARLASTELPWQVRDV